MSRFEVVHTEHLALGEVLTLWIGRYENDEPSAIFTVEDDGFIGFFGSAEGASMNSEDRRFWQCCNAYWTNLLNNDMQDTILRTFLYDGTRVSCHEDRAACKKANSQLKEEE